MYHNSTISIGPSRTTGRLLTSEPVFNRNDIIGVRCFIKYMPKLVIELIIMIVGNYQFFIYNPECISKVIVHFMSANLNRPVFKIFSVKELFPFFLWLRISDSG